MNASRRSETQSSLSTQVVRELRRRLEGERQTLLERATHQVDDDRFSLTATHGHGETELATRDVELGLATTLGNTAAASLDAIDAVLARLDTVDFGMCDTCGRPIPVERLLAVPEASRCVRCQQHHRERR